MSEATTVVATRADREQVRTACRRGVMAMLATLGISPSDAQRTDMVATFVAGYATAMLHQRALAVEPTDVLEHARAALAEAE